MSKVDKAENLQQVFQDDPWLDPFRGEILRRYKTSDIDLGQGVIVKVDFDCLHQKKNRIAKLK